MPRYKHGVQRTKSSRVSRLSVLIIVSDRVVVIEELGVPSVRFGLIDTFVFGARGILAFHESVFIIVIRRLRRAHARGRLRVPVLGGYINPKGDS